MKAAQIRGSGRAGLKPRPSRSRLRASKRGEKSGLTPLRPMILSTFRAGAEPFRRPLGPGWMGLETDRFKTRQGVVYWGRQKCQKGNRS